MQKKTTVPDFGTAVLLYGNDAQTVLLRGGGKCRALLLCRAGQHNRLRESFCGERAGSKGRRGRLVQPCAGQGTELLGTVHGFADRAVKAACADDSKHAACLLRDDRLMRRVRLEGETA